MRRSSLLALLILSGLAVSALFLTACDEKDVPVIINEEQIIDYLGHVASARELLRTDGLFNSTPYTVPFDSAVITDRVVGRKRSMEIDISDDSADYGLLGKVKESMVRVVDRFSVETSMAYTSDTLIDTVEIDLVRHMFFLQLGAITKPYAGWVLWGFCGIESEPPTVEVESSDGAGFFGGWSLYPEDGVEVGGAYARLSGLDTVTEGSRLLITVTPADTARSHLISDYGDGGAFTNRMVRYSRQGYFDSLSYTTPTDNPRQYNQFMVQVLTPVIFPRRSVLVVPYVAR